MSAPASPTDAESPKVGRFQSKATTDTRWSRGGQEGAAHGKEKKTKEILGYEEEAVQARFPAVGTAKSSWAQ